MYSALYIQEVVFLVQIRSLLHDPTSKHKMLQLSIGARAGAICRAAAHHWTRCISVKHPSSSFSITSGATERSRCLLKCFSTLADQPVRSPKSIRNVAVIAHVDVGKSTLVEGLIRECTDVRLKMDTGELEQERGITIASKVTSIEHDGTLINIVDSPGTLAENLAHLVCCMLINIGLI